MADHGLDRFYGAIRDVPDFPEPGIVFKDITPLLQDPDLLKGCLTHMTDAFATARVEKVLAIESRGFIFGAPVAAGLGAGLVLARKAGKLPWERHRVEYQLEYGTDVIEVHRDGFRPGERVLIVDDVLATGGTASAAVRAVRELGAEVVGCAFLIELGFLNGRDRLDGIESWSLLTYSPTG